MDEKTPFNVYNLSQIENNENNLPIFSYNSNSFSNQINNIEKILEFIILIIGFILNILISLSIIIPNSMRTSTGCYLFNLVICNIIALLDILGNVVDRWFHLNFKPDVDYINRVTLLVYIYTITVFSVDQFITICCNEIPWRITLSEISTAIKGILVIWSFASIFTAMEFHLYNKFQRQTVINLYTFITALYMITSTIIVFILNMMIIIQRMENRVNNKDNQWFKTTDSIRLLVGITVVFYLTLVPDRIMIILYYQMSFYSSTIALSIFYCIAKSSTIFGPIIWITMSKSLRKCLQAIVFDQWKT